MSPYCSLTILQAGVDWQDTPKDVFISILKLIGFVMLFIDQVFPNFADHLLKNAALPIPSTAQLEEKGGDSDCHVTFTNKAKHNSGILWFLAAVPYTTKAP